LSEEATECLRSIGEVAFLFAPNHYHHKGLKQYHEFFPDAELISSSAASARLEKQTDLEFSTLSRLTTTLPNCITILEPEGLKTGEVWLDLRVHSRRIWIVTDAFTGAGRPNREPSATVELLSSFPNFGIGDRAVYQNWLAGQISENEELLIIPCHGNIVAGPTISSQVLAVVGNLLT